MGLYLNGKSAYTLYQKDFSLTYFVDKTDILDELIPLLELKTDVSGNAGFGRGRVLSISASPGRAVSARRSWPTWSPRCTGRILAVGIAYDRKDEKKRHECKVEVLRERLG